MNCQRCMKNEKAAYRAFSDIIDMNVCAACASEAWSLGLTIESSSINQNRRDERARAMTRAR
jgi:hypothetical protein